MLRIVPSNPKSLALQLFFSLGIFLFILSCQPSTAPSHTRLASQHCPPGMQANDGGALCRPSCTPTTCTPPQQCSDARGHAVCLCPESMQQHCTVTPTKLFGNADFNHICSIQSDGSFYCWSFPERQYSTEYVPLTFPPLDTMAMGIHHACALDKQAKIICWGRDQFGQSSLTPNQPARSIAVGTHHSCAVDFAGQVQCWGDNQFGQLDIPKTLSKAVTIAATDHASCALRSDRQVICWGKLEPHLSPVSTHRIHAKKIKMNISALCWIDLNDQLQCVGQMPAIPNTLGAIKDFTMGFRHMCMREKTNNAITCWPHTNAPLVDAIVPPRKFGPVAQWITSGQGTCVIDPQQTIQCWPEKLHSAMPHKTHFHETVPEKYR